MAFKLYKFYLKSNKNKNIKIVVWNFAKSKVKGSTQKCIFQRFLIKREFRIIEEKIKTVEKESQKISKRN